MIEYGGEKMSNYNTQIDEINKMYPYGQFPTQYTKKQKEADINKSSTYNYYTNEKFNELNSIKVETMNNQSKPKESQNSNINIQSLMPLLSNLTDHKKMDSMQLLSTVLPLMLGKNSKDITSLLKLFGKKPEPQHDDRHEPKPLPKSNYNPIDSYDRA